MTMDWYSLVYFVCKRGSKKGPKKGVFFGTDFVIFGDIWGYLG